MTAPNAFGMPGMPIAGMPPLMNLPNNSMSPRTSSNGSSPRVLKDPIYAVRWSKPLVASQFAEFPSVQVAYLCQNQSWPKPSADGVVVLVAGTDMSHTDDMIASQQRECWHFFQAVQSWLEAGASGKVVIVSPASIGGALVVGASKSIALESPDFQITRCFLPKSMFEEKDEFVTTAVRTALAYPQESDLWIRSPGKTPVVPKLKPYQPPTEYLEDKPVMPASSPDVAGGSGMALSMNVYLLTGATGGLGSTVLDWLMDKQGISGDQLVIVSRRPMDPPREGIRVAVADISDVNSLLSNDMLKNLGKVSGVFHLAGCLEDTMAHTMTEEKLKKVLAPKSTAALNLVTAARNFEWGLEWFLAFSSTSALLGFPGQSNYCAANQMLDHLATFGLEDKLAEDDVRFVAVNWGPWGEVGMAKAGSKAHEVALKDGDRPLSSKEALRCLGMIIQAMQEEPPISCQFAVCDVDWDRSYHWAESPFAEMLRSQKKNVTDEKAQVAAVSEMGPIATFFCEHLDSQWSSLQNSTMAAAGLDSLDTVTMRNAFVKKFKSAPLSIFTKPNVTFSQLETSLATYV
eukprot:gnl/MRDRNA2_/MRDRNA2_65538_c0_seq1.p1 gnl/MRDRNA2_/MRDRNA2_65538_c0~~gnl/MRDRNA2_/MRDRNA2_65538_c0_seq1.p1  ORF type:complete len:655 (+),score=128.61 gnl/MRDRNA2_/MRDRNA2_65538_c0_seq1:248-1966(+)